MVEGGQRSHMCGSHGVKRSHSIRHGQPPEGWGCSKDPCGHRPCGGFFKRDDEIDEMAESVHHRLGIRPKMAGGAWQEPRIRPCPLRCGSVTENEADASASGSNRSANRLIRLKRHFGDLTTVGHHTSPLHSDDHLVDPKTKGCLKERTWLLQEAHTNSGRLNPCHRDGLSPDRERAPLDVKTTIDARSAEQHASSLCAVFAHRG